MDHSINTRSPSASVLTGFRLFRLFGFEVRLNLTWLLLALLITWTLAAGLFPLDYPDLDPTTYWWMGVAGAIGILFSIVFHELSHSLVARHFGLSIKGITLFIFGGMAQMQEEPDRPGVEFLMALAGPVASILLGLLLFGIEDLGHSLGWSTAVLGVCHYLAVVNMVVAVFNLIPAFPLDGGRMLRAGLWHRNHDLRRATSIASRIGSGFGLALMILGVLAFLQGSFIGGMWWFLIGAFLRFAAAASYRQLLVRQLLDRQPIHRFMKRDPVTVAPDMTIGAFMDDILYRHHQPLFPVIEDDRLTGCLRIADLKSVPRDQWAQRTVGDLARPCNRDNTLSPEDDAGKVLQRTESVRGGGCFLVVQGERLEGVLSARDLVEYVDLRLELE